MTAAGAVPLREYLRQRRDDVEDALRRFLPRGPACPPVISDAMGYSLFAGGKRLRPVLVLAAADASQFYRLFYKRLEEFFRVNCPLFRSHPLRLYGNRMNISVADVGNYSHF